MVKRGRPAKVLSNEDLIQLQQFLEKLPFLTEIQSHILSSLLSTEKFDEEIFKKFKTVDRYRVLYQQRQILLEQIKLKAHNQQKLMDNEVEILSLAQQDQDRDTWFRLERALESYQKIHKAVLNDRIRLENEHKHEVLNKSRKTLTEAQIKRNEENRRKYELGGAVLAAFKKLNIDISSETPDQITNRIVNNTQFAYSVRTSKYLKRLLNRTTIFLNDKIYFLMFLKAYQLGKVIIRNYQR